jgi:hypothetical protein
LSKNSFEENVFVNCPFDDQYNDLLKPLLFTIIKIGLEPRIASERLDSGEVRFEKIIELVKESKYGVHDLSRCRSSKENEYSRFNMPFELALDLACKEFSSDKKTNEKTFLILEEEKYSVQKTLSDLSFSDTECHKGEPEELVYKVRNWFRKTGYNKIESPSSIWDAYNYFYADLFNKKKKEGFSKKAIERLPIVEFLEEIKMWCK